VVLAAGVTATQRIVAGSPVLAAAEDLRAAGAVRCSDVLAARVWLDRKLPLQFRWGAGGSGRCVSERS
jgi:hypothetical protein